MKTVDTCTFCIKKKICMPTKPYHGFCQWRETEQTANTKQKLIDASVKMAAAELCIKGLPKLWRTDK